MAQFRNYNGNMTATATALLAGAEAVACVCFYNDDEASWRSRKMGEQS